MLDSASNEGVVQARHLPGIADDAVPRLIGSSAKSAVREFDSPASLICGVKPDRIPTQFVALRSASVSLDHLRMQPALCWQEMPMNPTKGSSSSIL
jgi:hypothetical protein